MSGGDQSTINNGFFKGKIITELSYISDKIKEHTRKMNEIEGKVSGILSKEVIEEIFERSCNEKREVALKEGCPAAERLFVRCAEQVVEKHLEYHKDNEPLWGPWTLIRRNPLRGIAAAILFVAYFNMGYRNILVSLIATGKIDASNFQQIEADFLLTLLVMASIAYLLRPLFRNKSDNV